MRTFLAIIAVLILAFGGVLFLSKGKASPQTSVDGTNDVGTTVNTTSQQTVDSATLLGDQRHTIGPADAPVTLVEFSDFQCPYCQIATGEIDKIIEQFGDNLHFVYRHFPLASHPLSQKAAEAAEAASAQDPAKFWDMYHLIFQNQTSLTADSFSQFASQIGLDVDKFNSDLESGKYASLPKTDYQDGVQLKVPGTPTFFLNGRQVTLSSFSDLSTLIQQELDKTTK